MGGVTRYIDYGAVATLFILGCIHNFVAAPLTYDVLYTRALWFITGGIVLWYGAIINFLWLRSGWPSWKMHALIALANAILLGFAIAFMAVKQSWADAQNVALLAPAAWLFVRAVLQARR